MTRLLHSTGPTVFIVNWSVLLANASPCNRCRCGLSWFPSYRSVQAGEKLPCVRYIEEFGLGKGFLVDNPHPLSTKTNTFLFCPVWPFNMSSPTVPRSPFNTGSSNAQASSLQCTSNVRCGSAHWQSIKSFRIITAGTCGTCDFVIGWIDSCKLRLVWHGARMGS